MPLTLCVGLSQKVGQPDYGSLGASCEVQVEVDPSLLRQDPDGLQRQVRQAYDACRRAVQEELARHAEPAADGHAANGQAANGHATNGHAANGTNSCHGNGRSNGSRSGRQATVSQARAIHAIASRQRLDLPAELRRRFGVERPEDLSLSEASTLIDELKGTATNGSGSRR